MFNGIFHIPQPVNEPILQYAPASRERAELKAELKRLRDEVGDLKRSLEARKLIERAKGIVMRDMDVGEQEAYRWLKRTSSQSNVKIAEIARRIVALDTTPRQ